MPRLVLASQSAGRRHLLTQAGYVFTVRTPTFDDPANPQDNPGHPPPAATSALADAQHLAARLALAKGQSVPATDATVPEVLLAADTIAVTQAGQLIGKPTTRQHAHAMLLELADAHHAVVTGMALRSPQGHWQSLADVAHVHMGPLDLKTLDAYLDSDLWQGKAGGYNLIDRQHAGWPLTVTGDPTTIVGLPMQQLTPLLAHFTIFPQNQPDRR